MAFRLPDGFGSSESEVVRSMIACRANSLAFDQSVHFVLVHSLSVRRVRGVLEFRVDGGFVWIPRRRECELALAAVRPSPAFVSSGYSWNGVRLSVVVWCSI